jgi:hypothetical protein
VDYDEKPFAVYMPVSAFAPPKHPCTVFHECTAAGVFDGSGTFDDSRHGKSQRLCKVRFAVNTS